MAKKSGSNGVNHIWIHLEVFEPYRFKDFNPLIWVDFAKIALVTTYMHQSLQTGSYFFSQETILSAEIVFRAPLYGFGT